MVILFYEIQSHALYLFVSHSQFLLCADAAGNRNEIQLKALHITFKFPGRIQYLVYLALARR